MTDRAATVIVFLLLALSPSVALAQQMYRWKDEKGQWRFSNVQPPPAATKPGTQVKTPQKPVPEEPEESGQPSPLSKPGKETGPKIASRLPPKQKTEDSPDKSSESWLFLTPPISRNRLHTAKPFSEWTVRKIFEDKTKCEESRKHIIRLFKNRQNIGIRSPYGSALYAKSRCIASSTVKAESTIER